jgi:SAM-dependent methyltransferase
MKRAEGETALGPADHARQDYYRDYWRAPELAASPHLRWNTEATRDIVRARAGRSVLDVGCGSGEVLASLRAPGVRLCGVEMSAGAVEALRARGIEASAVDLESGVLPFADGEFEIVLCYDVLEHLFAPGRLLREIQRVLRPEGIAAICVPNTLNLFNRFRFLAGEFVDIMDTSHHSEEMFSNHIRLFSKSLFERFVTANGCRVVERRYYFPERFSDPRFRLPSWLARWVTGPRLHERLPEAFALGFLYTCVRAQD